MKLDENSMQIESEGYAAGLNPNYGELDVKFSFPPLPYGHPDRKQFTNQVQQQLKNIHYYFSGELKLEIDLFLDEQKRYETPDLADLDNYAKLICDSIKGSEGILIDDSQIQSLSVIWIDTPEPPCFSIRVKAHPDEFMMKPVSFYEMPDGLYYPSPSKAWTKDGIVERTEESTQLLLVALHQIINNNRAFRHSLRQNRENQLYAYWLSRSTAPQAFSFHKNRILESGYIIHSIKDWKANIPFDSILKKLPALSKDSEHLDSDLEK